MKLWAILPELVLAGMCLGLVPVAGFVRGRWRVVPAVVSLIGLCACVWLTGRMIPWEPVSVFEGVYAVDGFAHGFKLVIFVGSIISVVMIMAYFRGKHHMAHAPVAVLFTTLGSVGMASSLDLGLIVLFLQMLSMGIYILAALVRSDFRGLEAALKYFIYGAVALAVMAYGLTFLYGLTGSLELRAIGAALQDADALWLVAALALVLVGYGFEMTMVPFHPWAPDVLDGATAPISGFISVVPKAAAIAGVLRFLVEGLAGGLVGWHWVVAGFAVATMSFGNLAALRQFTLKRLLAYSTIAQTGYILMAVAVAERSAEAIPAAVYYLGAYLFMNLGAFAVAAHVERVHGSDSFEVLRGLGRRAPAAAGVLAVALLSLAGFPPLGGFAGKVFVLKAVIEGGMTWLAVVGVLNMALALYYYARVIAEMYTRDAEVRVFLPPQSAFVITYFLTTAGMLALGVLPGVFYGLAQAAAEMLG